MAELIAVAYQDLPTARAVVASLGRPEKRRAIDLQDCVIVESRPGGKVKLHQPSLAGIRAPGGTRWGDLIGLISLLPVFSQVVGAAAGLAPDALSEVGLGVQFPDEFAVTVPSGAAVMVLLVRRAPDERDLATIQTPGAIVTTSLSDDQELHLREALHAAGARGSTRFA